VISSRPSTHVSSARESAVPANPIPGLKKKRSKFTCIDLLFCVRALMVSGHRCPDEEILARDTTLNRLSARTSSKEDAGLDGSKNGRAVTTSHLLWSNERRKCAFSLPIRLPNLNSLSDKCSADIERGGGGQPDTAGQKYHIDQLP